MYSDNLMFNSKSFKTESLHDDKSVYDLVVAWCLPKHKLRPELMEAKYCDSCWCHGFPNSIASQLLLGNLENKFQLMGSHISMNTKINNNYTTMFV